jgi:hypothetical protein
VPTAAAAAITATAASPSSTRDADPDVHGHKVFVGGPPKSAFVRRDEVQYCFYRAVNNVGPSMMHR